MTKEEYEKHQRLSKQNIERVQNMREFIRSKKPDLSISRFPKKQRDRFQKWAAEEYADDYGMLIIFLMEKYDEFVAIFPTLIDLEQRVNSLEQKLLLDKPYEKFKEIKMSDGSKRKVKVS